MRHKAKSKINHLLPRVMVCLTLLCVGLILSSCSSVGLHEHEALEQEQEQEQEQKQESQLEAQAQTPLPHSPADANPPADTSDSEKPSERSESALNIRQMAPERLDDGERLDSLDRPVPADTNEQEQTQSGDKASPVEESASVDDYSLPVDAPEIDPSKGGSGSDEQKQKREQESESIASSEVDAAKQSETSKAPEASSFSDSEKVREEHNAANQRDPETAVSVSSKKPETDGGRESQLESSRKTGGLESQIDHLENQNVAPTLDEKGLDDLAEKAAAMKQASSGMTPKVTGLDSLEGEKLKRGAELVTGPDYRTTDGEAIIGLKDENGATMQKQDPLVVVTETNNDDETVIEGHPSTVIYGVFNDGANGEALKRPARNIRWNLQRPPSSEYQKGE